ncbi:EF-hand calcium-binding domain-containing protein 1-like [Nilaparvata lugens]|uniref:EF-hand calcium-binding domain-containing protein 1-like n=1 Tax=Nilaparvata lugens TaxID=108931 RepID=UPI00193CBA85|nr:EF-hand calcium-binding domain-containing protein 1-like [Nilaparvata lugens]
MSSGAGTSSGVGGLMKSVSLFLSSGRRASLKVGGGGGGGRKAGTSTPGGGASVRRGRSRTTAVSSSCTGGRMADGAAEQQQPGGAVTARAGTTSSQQPTNKLVDTLRRQTHFSRQEIDALCRVYKKLVTSASSRRLQSNNGQNNKSSGIASSQAANEGLSRVMFRELLHNTFDVVTEEVLMERIFSAFDRQAAGWLRLEDWLLGLSVFLRGTLEERALFAFHVYDLNNDGFISREEMFLLLRNSLVKHPQDDDPDEGVKDLVELAVRKMDADRDGRLSQQDFRAAIAQEPLLLEAFGQCLPTHTAANTFLATLL